MENSLPTANTTARPPITDPRAFTYETIGHMWHGLNRYMMESPAPLHPVNTPSESILYDVHAIAQSSEMKFDLGEELFLGKARWTALVNQYLDLGRTTQFFQMAQNIALGKSKLGAVASLDCNYIAPDLALNRHAFGGCITAFTYYGSDTHGPVPPTLTMFSRTSYINYIGGLDLALASVIARYIGQYSAVPQRSIRFVWHASSLQFHYLKGLAYALAHIDEIEPFLKLNTPAGIGTARALETIIGRVERSTPLSSIIHGPSRRVQACYLKKIGEQPTNKSVPVAELDLGPLFRP